MLNRGLRQTFASLLTLEAVEYGGASAVQQTPYKRLPTSGTYLHWPFVSIPVHGHVPDLTWSKCQLFQGSCSRPGGSTGLLWAARGLGRALLRQQGDAHGHVCLTHERVCPRRCTGASTLTLCSSFAWRLLRVRAAMIAQLQLRLGDKRAFSKCRACSSTLRCAPLAGTCRSKGCQVTVGGVCLLARCAP